MSLVVTQPDRPCGRGQQINPPPVKSNAACRELALAQPEKIDTSDLRRRLEELSPDVVVVVAFGQKIPPGSFPFRV